MQLKNISIQNKLVLMVSLMMAIVITTYLTTLSLSRMDLIESKKMMLKSVVDSAVSQLEFITKQSSTPLEDAKKTIYSIRFNGSDYLFVYNDQGENIIHPTLSHLEGKNLLDIQDKKGTYISRVMIDGIQKHGEIYWQFFWPKPPNTIPIKKLSYARSVEGTDWIVGAGVYIDDLNEKFYSRATYYSLAAFFTLLAFYLLARKISLNITKPASELVSQINKLTRGDHSVEVTNQHRRDEFGLIAEALQLLKQQSIENSSLKLENEAVKSLELFDPTTQLMTRKAFGMELSQLLESSTNNKLTAVLIVKIPLLRDILAQWGSEYCNKVIVELSQRVQSSLAEQDILARYGDDTLALIRPNLVDVKEIVGLVNSIQTLIIHPTKIDNQELSFQSQIGVSIAPEDANQELQLISHAEEALSEARRLELDYILFNQLKTFALDEKLELWKDIQKALEEDQFYLVFQPLYDLRTNEIISAEVLLRWEHPEQGFISPAKFVAFAEQSGLVSRLDNWVIKAAARQIYEWNQQGLEVPSLAINLSGLTFIRADMEQLIKDATQDTPIPLDKIELELTEGVLIESIETLQHKLTTVQALGINVSIDDFGTGYSSLSRIRNLKIDKVKIDRSFINDLEESKGDKKIIEAITHMAQGLGFKVVAEGVETLGQLNMLRSMNCDIVQGFLLSKPLKVDQFEALLDNENLIIEVD